MQLHVLTGPQASGKTRRLRARQDELHAQDISVVIITGNTCTTPYLIARIQQHVEAGARYFLADDCTREQIKAVQKLNLPEYFTLYLVRQA
ncbi:KTI12 family protein [Pseudomonas marginalis]|jgi:hypothetical protein|uniref:KTI12 family protein n=1 Tax=Pseudomonas marginalis TaxID=298 RepID=UPI0020347C30|nr:KTI12 family protein [Pseudomonas marginalis]MCM2377828.1 KTI12 family protein [Pseudomonas marginalis]